MRNLMFGLISLVVFSSYSNADALNQRVVVSQDTVDQFQVFSEADYAPRPRVDYAPRPRVDYAPRPRVLNF